MPKDKPNARKKGPDVYENAERKRALSNIYNDALMKHLNRLMPQDYRGTHFADHELVADANGQYTYPKMIGGQLMHQTIELVPGRQPTDQVEAHEPRARRWFS